MPARFASSRSLLAGATILAAAGLVAGMGCAPSATYPKIEGSIAIDQPRLAPIPELMADAIETAREEVATEAGGRIAFNLPEDTPVAVWNEVLRRVPGSVPATDADQAVVHVTQVRLRGNDADVDVVVEPREARPTATPYLLTVTMKQEFLRDWKVTRSRAWRLPVDVPALAWVPAGGRAVAAPEAVLPPAEGEPAEAGVVEPVAQPADDADGAPAPSPSPSPSSESAAPTLGGAAG